MAENKLRKRRSTLDSLLLEPTMEDRKLQAALNEWARGAIVQLGGPRNVTASQKAQLHAAKISLSIILAEGQVIKDVGDFANARVKLATRNFETHQAVLRKHLRDLGLLSKPSPRVERGSMVLGDIVREYAKRGSSG